MRTSFTPSSQRGSVLLVALLLAIIIGISLVSYIKVSNNSLKLAQRSFYYNSSMNYAEIGLEEAIACFNQIDNVATPADAWTAWTTNTTPYNATTSPTTPYAVKTFSGFSAGPNTTAAIKVYVHFHTADPGTTPVIVAKSTITQADGSPAISKFIEVTLRKRSLFANGLVARENITWVGQPSADSWDSDPENDGTHVPYDTSLRTANAVVGSISGSIGLGGGEVWGYAKTGEFGSITGGSVHPLGTTTNDPTRRTNDFNATFPNPITPAPATFYTMSSNINSSTTLPRGGDAPITVAGVPTYYYVFDSGTQITLSGSDRLSIAAGKNVVIIMNAHSGAEAIKTTGSAGIDVNLAASLNIYTNGDIKIAGNGMANDNNNAASMIVWGTNSSSQTIDISGNGQLTGCVYAPNAILDLNGGGTDGLMCGSAIAKTITMNGNTKFHYDDALGRLTTGNPYGISKWRELQTGTERNAYSTQLSF